MVLTSSQFNVVTYLAAWLTGVRTLTSSLRPRRYIIPSLAADLLGCISPYQKRTKKQTRNKSHHWPAGTAHGETTPPLDCEINMLKPVPGPFVLDRIQSKKKERKKERTPNWSLSSTITAFLDGWGGICPPAPEHYWGFPLPPKVYKHICIWPTEWGNPASVIAIWIPVYDQLPTLLSRWWSSVEVRTVAGLRLEVSIDQVVTGGKRCGSASFLASLICKHCNWWLYSQCTVPCVCSRAS